MILKDESGDSQFFSIDSRSGVIVTRASFDREQKASYLIEVQSQDSSESSRPGQQGQPNTGNAWCTLEDFQISTYFNDQFNNIFIFYFKNVFQS